MDGGVAFYKRQGDPGMAPCTDAQLQDRDFVLGLVAHCGLALSLAAPHLKEDADVVLAAVRQSGWALEFASAALRGDRELVLLAVEGWARNKLLDRRLEPQGKRKPSVGLGK